MELHLIVNETAGNGQGKKRSNAIQQQLHVPYYLHITHYSKHAQLIVEDIAASTKQALVIAIGGDGTINEVIGAARHFPQLVVGVIAAGSGNDFSRAYPTFETAADIERYLQAPEQSLFDYGTISGLAQPYGFVNNSGVGFDAYVAIQANESTLKKRLNKWALGKLSYIYFVMVGLFRFKPFTLHVQTAHEKKTYEHVWFATVSNQPYFGGGMKLSPTSNMQDKQLELTVVHNLPKFKFLLLFGTVFFGKHTSIRGVVQQTSNAFQLQLENPQPMHTDGEKVLLQQASTLTFQVAEQKWQLAQKK